MAKQNALSSFAGGGLTELWSRLRFLVLAIIVYRIGAHIPVPGINPDQLKNLFQQQGGTIFDLFNMFSGGSLVRMSIFALGIMPYISASIIMQLMTAVVPSLEQLRKEGEAGRRKITQYTRYGALALAIIQAIGMSLGLASQGVTFNTSFSFFFIAVATFVAGSMFLMWLGEQITERGVGNGISMLIFAGIVAGIPSAIVHSLAASNETGDHLRSLLTLLLVGVLIIAIVAFVVFVERGQRRIEVSYARRQQQGYKNFSKQTSHLPLIVNMSGVIPAIFASSILLFPASIAQWFGQSEKMSWLKSVATLLAPNQPLYVLLFIAGIVFFCFFYTALVFNPKDVAENLKKSGAFIPGIRPGEHTARYIDGVLTRLTLFGAMYMAAVCLLPQFLISKIGLPFYLGGTSLLIVVVVVMDFMAQVQSHLVSHQYDSLMKKSNLKSYGK